MLHLLKRGEQLPRARSCPLLLVSLVFLWDIWQLAFTNLSAVNVSRSSSFAGRRMFGTYKGMAAFFHMIGSCQIFFFLVWKLNWQTEEKKMHINVHTVLCVKQKIKCRWGWMKHFSSLGCFSTISEYPCDTTRMTSIRILTAFWKLPSLLCSGNLDTYCPTSRGLPGLSCYRVTRSAFLQFMQKNFLGSRIA